MKLATREQVARIDSIAMKKFGYSEESLVELAAHALLEQFETLLSRFKIRKTSRIGVWCGPGLNGADGKKLAELLANKGFAVEVLKASGWDPREFEFIIDALFGVGLNREIKGELASQIEKLNSSRVPVIAIDLPSGLDANTGKACGVAVQAKATLTIYPPKPGLFLNEGPAKSGRVQVARMKLPKHVYENAQLDTFLFQNENARRVLPRRSSTGNKSGFGHLLVVAGSAGMEGAAAMVTEAAARMGCGYVTLCTLSSEVNSYFKPDYLRLAVTDFFESDLKKYHAVVIGPGLGRSEQALRLVKHVLANHGKVLVDADALSVLAEIGPVELPTEWLLTPHAGELSRLIGTRSAELEADRLEAAEMAQAQWKAHVLFKGFRTVLRNSRESVVVYSGNVALAKAGTGDILAGFIGSLMAQGLTTMQAATLGAYLHGKIADDWLKSGHSDRTLMASDLPSLLDATLSRLKKHR